ncbi:MAG: HAMP domain-containing protein [Deltaproteobacteria bacterium]|nr:HAMP domain-containing protein [Deltaproteobacteria bacterium]
MKSASRPWRPTRLSTRLMLAFVLVGVAFASSMFFSIQHMQQIRDDLRLLHRGYLAMSRLTSQLRVLHEAKSDEVEQTLELDGFSKNRQRTLKDFSQSFYPRAMRDRLKKLEALSINLGKSSLSREDLLFLRGLQRSIEKSQMLLDEDVQAAVTLLNGDLESGLLLQKKRTQEGAEIAGGLDGGVLIGAGADSIEERISTAEKGSRLEQYRVASTSFYREVSSLSSRMESKISRSILRAESNERDAVRNMLYLFALSMAVGGASLFWVRVGLRPLSQLLEVARTVTRGNLNVIVEDVGEDELGTLARAFNDMTKSVREREQSLAARSEELLLLKRSSDDVIRSVRVGIVVLDEDTRVFALNPAARSIFHLPLVDMEGRLLHDIELPALLDEILARIPLVLSTGSPEAFGLVSIHERKLNLSLVPVQDATGQRRQHVLLLGDDVSEQERTKEQLLESERLAAIGRLAAQITHEIRNPLSSVALNIELLGDDIPYLPTERQAEMRSILDAVGGEVERLTQITEGYLRFARLPGTRLQDGDVGDVLADLVAFSQKEAALSEVMLELNVEEGLPKVPHDPARLRQALLNLLKNGLEATGAGGTVRLSVRADGKDFVQVKIDDSGTGFNDDTKENLFVPFFTTKEGGTGLGLTVAKEIIEEHGGEISIHNSVLGGASLRVHLPCATSTVSSHLKRTDLPEKTSD